MNYKDFFSTTYIPVVHLVDQDQSGFSQTTQSDKDWSDMGIKKFHDPSNFEIQILKELPNGNGEISKTIVSKEIRNDFEYTRDILVFLQKDIITTHKFLEYHMTKYFEKTGEKKTFLIFIQEMLTDFPEISDERKKTILEWVDEKKDEIKKDGLNLNSGEKITWKGTPSQFAYLLLELVRNGFIELPTRSGNGSYAKLAKLCFNSFSIDTTQENLIKELNPNKNTLSDTKRAKFTISDTEITLPDISEIA